jgi:serine/threonine protein kinase/tetratricopeptide (TPR) repeat protein
MIGQKLGHYRIVEKIGAGGMGEVYRAHDEQLDRDVALKVLPSGTIRDEAARKQFRKEALALAKLNHPNIETVHEFGTQEGVDFLAMELIAGSSLNRKLKGGPLDEKEIVRLGMQFAGGLAAAHEQGVVHRDLKPANLMVTPEGWLKILDFGLAKLIHLDVFTDITRSITVESGTISGTVPYMAPEQLRGMPVDPRADIYAAGAVLYEMTTGCRPFPQLQSAELMGAILHQSPAPPSSINPRIAPGLDSAILKALEKEPSQRYQSARELLVALEGISQSAVVSTMSTGSASRIAPAALPAVGPVIVPARRNRWLSAASAAIVTALAAAAYFYIHRAPKLTEKDTIVLADFTNTTGDSVFDGTLRQGLSVQLEQSPFLSIISDQQIQQTLQMMDQKPDVMLTPKIARELCQRAGSAAVLDGSVAQIGKQYLLTVTAIDCESGGSLASTAAQASDKDHVLDALGKTASEIRNKLGESLSTLQKFDSPLEQVTTPSLDALQAYSRGVVSMTGKSDFTAAIPQFDRAIRLDPNFALAYAALATCYYDLGESAKATEFAKKAYDLRDRVSERERFSIESRYHLFATGNLEKARQALELSAENYPRDVVARGDLGANYGTLGEYDKGLAASEEAARLAPGSALALTNLFATYVELNRFEDARSVAEEARTKKLDSPPLRLGLYQVGFLQNDAAEMAKQVNWAMGQSGIEDAILSSEADAAAYSGHLRKARAFSRQAVTSALRADEKETASGYEAIAAIREALFGNPTEARQRSTAALALSTARDVEYGIALTSALVGANKDSQTQIEKLVDNLAHGFAEDTVVQFDYLPTIKALVEINLGNPAKAVEILEVARPYELGSPSNISMSLSLYPVYVRGLGLLSSKKGAPAATEFQKILAHRGIVQTEPIGALAHLGLARAHALQGDKPQARAAYQDFFALWKDADPDIPILQQAKAEYAKLR